MTHRLPSIQISRGDLVVAVGWALLSVLVLAALGAVLPEGADMLKNVFGAGDGQAPAGTPAEIVQVASATADLAKPLLWISVGLCPLVAGVGAVMMTGGHPGGMKLIYGAVGGPLFVLLTRGLAA